MSWKRSFHHWSRVSSTSRSFTLYFPCIQKRSTLTFAPSCRMFVCMISFLFFPHLFQAISYIPPIAEEFSTPHLQSMRNPVHEAIKALNMEQFQDIMVRLTFPRLIAQLQRANATDAFITNLIHCRMQMHPISEDPLITTSSLDNETNALHSAQLLHKLNTHLNLNYCQQLMTESSNLLFSACETAHMNCAKLYSIRQEQHTRLSIHDFEHLYSSTLQFIEQSETLCHRQCLGFRGTLISQVRGILITIATLTYSRPKDFLRAFMQANLHRWHWHWTMRNGAKLKWRWSFRRSQTNCSWVPPTRRSASKAMSVSIPISHTFFILTLVSTESSVVR